MANMSLSVASKWDCGALMALREPDRLPQGFVFPVSCCVGNYIKFFFFFFLPVLCLPLFFLAERVRLKLETPFLFDLLASNGCTLLNIGMFVLF